MSDNDNNNVYDEATPLDELMDAPTPMDEPTSIDSADDIVDEEDDPIVEDGVQLDDYVLIAARLIRKGENGHADVYQAVEADTHELMILKLYQPGIEPKNANALYFVNQATLNGIQSLHLVPLYEYGWYEDKHIGQKRFYELQKWMEGGSLDGLPSNTDIETLKTIVTSAAYALYSLHNCFI